MRLRLFLGLILLAGATRAFGAIYDARDTGFVLETPEGWAARKDPVERFPVLFGPAADPLAPMLVVTEMTPDRDLFAMGDATVRELLRDPDNQIVTRDGFLTADRRPGLKYVLKTLTPGGPYRQIFYFVEGPGPRRFSLLATVAEEGWEKYEIILDNILKTYRLREGAAPVRGAGAPPSAPLPPKPPAQSPLRPGGK